MQEITPIVENAETEDVDFGENNHGMKMS
jgi:hypothetical protein